MGELTPADFGCGGVLQQLSAGPDRRQLAMSDIAPKKSGMTQVDRDRSMHLVELALDFAERPRQRGGDFLAKSGSAAGFSAAAAAAYDARGREDQATGGEDQATGGGFLRAQSGTLSAGSAVVL